MSEKVDDELVVRGEPTKEFFISMLVRDIGLIPAIVDLVDNSVDGARRVRPTNGDVSDQARRFDGLYVAIRISPDAFEIADN